MPTLSQIIQVTVDRQTTAVPQAGFGNVLFLSFNAKPGTITGDFAVYTQDDYSGDFAGTTDEGKALQAHFRQDLTPQRAYVGGFITAASAAAATTALNSLKDATKSGFYCVIPVGTTDADTLKGVADWAEANNRIAFFQTDSTDAYGAGTSDLGATLQAANLTRSAVFWGKTADEYIDAAAAGRGLPAPPGSFIWAYKRLNGVSESGLNTTQLTALDGKNYNYLHDFGGNSVIFNGKMADGGFIDLIRDTDWLVSRLRESMIFELVNDDKIPYNQQGADIIQGALLAVLETAVREGVISDGYTTDRAALSEVSANDRANRKFPRVTVSGRYAGALQSVEFRLSLTV